MDEKQDVFENGFEARRRLQKLLIESQEAESDLAGQLFDMTLDGVRGMLERGEEVLCQPLSTVRLPTALDEAARAYRLSYQEMTRLLDMGGLVDGEIQSIEKTIGGGVWGRFRNRNKVPDFHKYDTRRDTLIGVRDELKVLLKANFDRRKQSAGAWFEALLSTPNDQDAQSGLQAAFNCLETAGKRAHEHWVEEAARQLERIQEGRKCLETMERLYSQSQDVGDQRGR